MNACGRAWHVQRGCSKGSICAQPRLPAKSPSPSAPSLAAHHPPATVVPGVCTLDKSKLEAA